MVPNRPLSHDEAIEALRGFLKERSSYDVFPVSFRLIVLDTQLKVKKALDVMLLYGAFCRTGPASRLQAFSAQQELIARCRFRSIMEHCYCKVRR